MFKRCCGPTLRYALLFDLIADDGEADRKEADNIWKVNGDDLGNNATYVTHAMTFPGIDWGEIEGLDFDEDKCEMYVLSNRGRQIVLGMVSNCIVLTHTHLMCISDIYINSHTL